MTVTGVTSYNLRIQTNIRAEQAQKIFKNISSTNI